MRKLDHIRAVVTDIEGTTSSVAFVRDQLFPYARRVLCAYVQEHAGELEHIRRQIETEVDRRNLGVTEMVEILMRWMDEDRKVTPLKTLQGLIWSSGYACGEVQGHVYQDAVRALRNWHALGIGVYIYSSGSIEAQRLLFAHTEYGDLTPLLAGYFDTTTGSKMDPGSYRSIVRSLSLDAGSVLFLSDHSGETRAAAEAGLQSILVARAPTIAEHAVRGFDDIELHT